MTATCCFGILLFAIIPNPSSSPTGENDKTESVLFGASILLRRHKLYAPAIPGDKRCQPHHIYGLEWLRANSYNARPFGGGP